jgi:hypothetical protein
VEIDFDASEKVPVHLKDGGGAGPDYAPPRSAAG